MELLCMPGVVHKKYIIFKEYLDAGFSNALLDFSEYCQSDSIENREEIYETWYKNKKDILFIPLQPEKIGESVTFYLDECEKIGVKNVVGKAPYLLDNTKRMDSDALIFKLTKESIKVCGQAKCKYILILPLIREMKTDNDWEKNIEFYLSFVEYARENNLLILIPNHYDNFHGHLVRGTFADAYILKRMVEELNNKVNAAVFGIAMDTGVCNLCGQNMFEFMSILRNEIKVLILKENNGYEDSSLMPFTAIKGKQTKFDWLNLIRGLRNIEFDGAIIIDFLDTQSAVSHIVRPALIKYEKELADFLVWQILMEQTIKKYSTRVLFGAGKMCRNYMRCYGELYPPLFACDNNTKIWDTKLEGLIIKNPEELRKIPPDCAIFICNIYYREIKTQMESMGIHNPIEFFSDEYLPSMVANRFDE